MAAGRNSDTVRGGCQQPRHCDIQAIVKVRGIRYPGTWPVGPAPWRCQARAIRRIETMSKTTQAKIESADSTDQLVCSCFEYSIADLQGTLADNPGLTFQELLDITGVGSKCTACLLDLEFNFTQHASVAPDQRGGAASKRRTKRVRQDVPLKQRVYRVLDSVSPMSPMRLRSPMPVLYGAGVESYFCMTNNALLYRSDAVPPVFDVALEIRDAKGKVVKRLSDSVPPETYRRFCVSEYLDPGPEPERLQIGTIDIVQTSRTPGVRGTRRPQIEYVTAGGAAALHGQAPYKKAQKSFFVCPTPGPAQRSIMTIVSVSPAPVHLKVRYPIDDGTPEDAVATKQIDVPAMGAALLELDLPDGVSAAGLPPAMTVGWEADGPQKVHLVSASANVDRLSLDHL